MSKSVALLEASNPYIKSLPANVKKDQEDLVSDVYRKAVAFFQAALYIATPLACSTGALKNPSALLWGAVIGLGIGLTYRSIKEIYNPTKEGYIEDFKNWLEMPARLISVYAIAYFLAKLFLIGGILTLSFRADNIGVYFGDGALIGFIMGSELMAFSQYLLSKENKEEKVVLL